MIERLSIKSTRICRAEIDTDFSPLNTVFPLSLPVIET
jgi:hypothetical protein